MTKREAKELSIKYLDKFMVQNGFVLKKSSEPSFTYRRQLDGGYDAVGFGYVDYNPTQIIRYSVFKRINSIEEVCLKIGQVINKHLNPPFVDDSISLAFGDDTLHGYPALIKQEIETEHMDTEEDIERNIDKIIAFLKSEAFPLLEKFNDIREIDKIINDPNNFWDTDWKKMFNLGGNFIVKRLVIAKLAGRSDFDSVVRMVYESVDRRTVETAGLDLKVDRVDLSTPLPFTVHFLQSVPLRTFDEPTKAPRQETVKPSTPKDDILSKIKSKLLPAKKGEIKFTPSYDTPFNSLYSHLKNKEGYYALEDVLFNIFDGAEVFMGEFVYILRSNFKEDVHKPILIQGLKDMMADNNARICVLKPTFVKKDSEYIPASQEEKHTIYENINDWDEFYSYLEPLIDQNHPLHTAAWKYYDDGDSGRFSISSRRYIGDMESEE